MPFVPAPNIIMVEMRALRNGQRVENRIMINATGEPQPADLSDAAIMCWNWWENTYAPLLNEDTQLSEVVATSLHEQNGAQFTYAPDTTTTGTFTGPALPNEVSLCVSLRTGARGRSARGRFYVLSISDDQRLDNNHVTTAVAGAFAQAVRDLNALIIGNGWLMVIVSYRANKVPRPGGPVYFQVTNAIVVDTIVDSMKSRKPGVGT